MIALLSVAAACALAAPAPGYTSHFREMRAPEQVVRVRRAGDEVVTDTVERLRLPAATLGQMDLWVIRPGPTGEPRVLRVDWPGIAERGLARTNYVLVRG